MPEKYDLRPRLAIWMRALNESNAIINSTGCVERRWPITPVDIFGDLFTRMAAAGAIAAGRMRTVDAASCVLAIPSYRCVSNIQPRPNDVSGVTNYLTPQSRRGIFIASDSDKDGFVTQTEYILNRIITDEAKAIVQAMDDDKDRTIQSAEFVKHATAKLGNAHLARDVFAALDTNGN